jgi:hypothetical protein
MSLNGTKADVGAVSDLRLPVGMSGTVVESVTESLWDGNVRGRGLTRVEAGAVMRAGRHCFCGQLQDKK